ncbi:hypothetical protein [Oceanobacillus indicireducens]|uniref:Uncharacterized protein n=1 Tax=Oceanobacillus indicireducens TaxID=1004261 RepID=A0A917XSL6_9BACI|nr:hypothetical protein [Oceanobacillus indicireducens]GGN51996.1 hypothetical protein GCM10007971_07090 [Oceanobacillus indicireducens]
MINEKNENKQNQEVEMETAGRVGLRLGKVSELTVIAPLKEGGAERLRKKLSNNPDQMEVMARIATVHDMRWVIFDDDKRLLFATAYDGDWDAYIDDFGTKIPELLDHFFSEVVDYPGINDPTIKDFIAKHQVTATGWYCAYPNSTVRDIWRGERSLKAFNDLIDAVQGY